MGNAAPVSMRVAATTAAYRIVRVNAANQVTLATATLDALIGVTTDEATNANQAVPVAVSGIAKVECNDTIAAGGLVMTDSAGRGIPATATTAGVYVLGTCLNTVTATGTLAEVLVNPFQVDIP